ncbi:unnamed protein product, partial [Staurois parvus]
QNSPQVFDWGQIRRHTWLLNHFHPVLLQKCNSGLKCVLWIIAMLEKLRPKAWSDGSIFSFSIEHTHGPSEGHCHHHISL